MSDNRVDQASAAEPSLVEVAKRVSSKSTGPTATTLKWEIPPEGTLGRCLGC
jgi:hypothetical protein